MASTQLIDGGDVIAFANSVVRQIPHSFARVGARCQRRGLQMEDTKDEG